MPGRRYPRPGHRIAPRLLADVLQGALPVELRRKDLVRLGDLDERAWEHFDPETCKALAAEVVHAVGRAARQPSPFARLPLPQIPAGMSLADLELESRTFNCLVAAGIEDRPQDLERMTIESALGLRGFWSKCLVDLLTAIEHASDHPETRGKSRRPRIARARNRDTFGHYPRRGYCLAPATLRGILEAPVPGREITTPSVRGLRLCDLDAQVSLELTDAERELLARAIIARVNISSHCRALRELSIPSPPKGMRLQDLALENRTYNCLLRDGLAGRFEEIGKYTIGDLLSLKAFGAKCLLDLLSSLETAMARSARLNTELTQEAVALGKMPEASLIHFSDPRLGSHIRSIDTEANTLADLAGRFVRRRVDPPDPSALAQRISAIRQRVVELEAKDLGTELAEVFCPGSQSRDREIVSAYYGWDGRGGCTLEDLGNKHRLSRERIRQVCMRATKRHLHAPVFAPALDRALEFVRSRVPAAVRDLERDFEASGLGGLFLPPATLLKAAEFLSRDAEFETATVGSVELVVDTRTSRLPRTISQIARRLASGFGMATVSDLAQHVEKRHGSPVELSLLRAVLESLEDFQWLEETRNWFRLEPGPQDRLPNMIEKVFSVCPHIEASRLRSALERHRRSGRKVPPNKVLLAFCEQNPGIIVEGQILTAVSPRSSEETLSGVEALMVRVLQKHGPVLDRGAFEEFCAAEGMNRFSFNATLMGSPVITQLGRSVYGLIGATATRSKVRSLSAKGASSTAPRVLRGFGSLADGRVYLSYRLSKAAIAGGVTTVPAAIRNRLQGEFTIRTADGVESGKLVARNGCAWGLGPALRNQRARPGDHMVLLVDMERNSAHVYLGERDLLDTLIESLSLQVAETWESESFAPPAAKPLGAAET